MAMASSACFSSPRTTLAVTSQNMTWRYSAGSSRRLQSSWARVKVAIAGPEAGPCVAIKQGAKAK